MRLLPLMFLVLALSGCLGNEARSEWAFEITQIDAVYEGGTRGLGIVVAVLDTGVNTDHPSLDHLDDGKKSNGELIAFRDFLGSANTVGAAFDDDGHGSHIVGIMSARGSSFGDKLVNGGVDLLGASPGIELAVARVCDATHCDAAKIDDAIRWSVGRGADVISLSLGGAELGFLGGVLNPGDQQIQNDITDAINDAIDRGIVVVAAAGNEQGDGATDVAFPSSIAGVISVGAIDSEGRLAGFSSHGDPDSNSCRGGPFVPQTRCAPNQKPEVVAPGVGILSAWTGDAYVRADGTSQATPFVTALVALMLDGKPQLRDRDDVRIIKEVLMDTAEPLAGQRTPHDNGSGYGIIQAAAAVAAYQG